MSWKTAKSSGWPKLPKFGISLGQNSFGFSRNKTFTLGISAKTVIRAGRPSSGRNRVLWQKILTTIWPKWRGLGAKRCVFDQQRLFWQREHLLVLSVICQKDNFYNVIFLIWAERQSFSFCRPLLFKSHKLSIVIPWHSRIWAPRGTFTWVHST